MNENERELLSAYLDGSVTKEEAAALERRLTSDPALRLELDTLRETQLLIRNLPTLRVPRSLTLTQAMIRPHSRPLYLSAWVSFASAAAALVLMIAGFFASFNLTSPAPAQLIIQASEANVAVVPTTSLTLVMQETDAVFAVTGTPTLIRDDQTQMNEGTGAAGSAAPAPLEARTAIMTPTADASAALMAAPAAENTAGTDLAMDAVPPAVQSTESLGELESAAELQFAATMPSQPSLAPTFPPQATLGLPTPTITLSATAQPTLDIAALATDTVDTLPQDEMPVARQTAENNTPLLLIGAGIVLLLVALVTTLLRMRDR